MKDDAVYEGQRPSMENTIVYWAISTFDRTKENPLPVETRFWILPWTSVSEDEAKDISTILQIGGEEPDSSEPLGLSEEEHILTFSKRDLWMIK